MPSPAAQKRAAAAKKPAAAPAAAAPAPAAVAAPARTKAPRATSPTAGTAATAATAPAHQKVEATQMGFYDNKRRREGDTFTITDPKHFSKRWMKPVDAATPEKTTTGNQAIAKAHDITLADKVQNRGTAPKPKNPIDGGGDDE